MHADCTNQHQHLQIEDAKDGHNYPQQHALGGACNDPGVNHDSEAWRIQGFRCVRRRARFQGGYLRAFRGQGVKFRLSFLLPQFSGAGLAGGRLQLD